MATGPMAKQLAGFTKETMITMANYDLKPILIIYKMGWLGRITF